MTETATVPTTSGKDADPPPCDPEAPVPALFRITYRTTCPDCLQGVLMPSKRCAGQCHGTGYAHVDVYLPAPDRDTAEKIGQRLGEVIIATPARIASPYRAADYAVEIEARPDEHGYAFMQQIVGDLRAWERGAIR